MNHVKDFLDEYHDYRLNKSVMAVIVPFILVVAVIIGALVVVPLYKSRNQALEAKEQYRVSWVNMSKKYDNLESYSQNLEEALAQMKIDNQWLLDQNNDLNDNVDELNTVVNNLTTDRDNYKELSEELSIQVHNKNERIEQLHTDSAVLASLNEEMESNINHQGHLIYKLRAENTQLLGNFDSLQSKLTFYAYLYSPPGERKPRTIFMNLAPNDFQSTFNKQVEEPSVDPARVNVSPRKVQKSERSKMGLFIALPSGGGAALLVFVILYARKRRNNSDYRLAC